MNAKMDLFIVSDLHIGSRFFAHGAFEKFLSQVPEYCELVLNGDVIDNPYSKLTSSNRIILDRIKQLSIRQNVRSHQAAFYSAERNLASGKS
jgi:DNA polymerase II small subunit/DNA polymerase delta subunit B